MFTSNVVLNCIDILYIFYPIVLFSLHLKFDAVLSPFFLPRNFLLFSCLPFFPCLPLYTSPFLLFPSSLFFHSFPGFLLIPFPPFFLLSLTGRIFPCFLGWIFVPLNLFCELGRINTPDWSTDLIDLCVDWLIVLEDLLSAMFSFSSWIWRLLFVVHLRLDIRLFTLFFFI